MLAIGLMSGTSLDGCDCVLVRIEEGVFTVVDYINYQYEKDFVIKAMRNLSDATAKLSEICSLNFEFGDYFARAILEILNRNNLSSTDIEFVASHGQTIWHQPKKTTNLVASTLQIGSPSVITAKTGIKVISNFREMDIACGGEGAPLVPMSEYMLYRDANLNIALQNIGGVSNVTYIKKNAQIGDVIAFDTGPGNIMINYFTNKYFGKEYDEDGKIAKKGDIIKTLYDYLTTDEFILRTPPKSTGREQYSVPFMENLVTRFDLNSYDPCDVITTISEITVYANIYNYKNYLGRIDKLIVSGGGCHNLYIMDRLKEELEAIVCTGDDVGISADSKEALAFVVLGYLTLNNKPGNVKSATGASKDAVLGNITPKGE